MLHEHLLITLYILSHFIDYLIFYHLPRQHLIVVELLNAFEKIINKVHQLAGLSVHIEEIFFFMIAIIHPLNLLSSRDVPGTLLGAGNANRRKTTKLPAIMESTF